MYTVSQYNNILNSGLVTISHVSAVELFVAGSLTPTATRQAVWITNVDATANIYIIVSNLATTAGTSTSKYQVKLTPGSDRTFHAGQGAKFWLFSDGAGDTNVFASELQ